MESTNAPARLQPSVTRGPVKSAGAFGVGAGGSEEEHPSSPWQRPPLNQRPWHTRRVLPSVRKRAVSPAPSVPRRSVARSVPRTIVLRQPPQRTARLWSRRLGSGLSTHDEVPHYLSQAAVDAAAARSRQLVHEARDAAAASAHGAGPVERRRAALASKAMSKTLLFGPRKGRPDFVPVARALVRRRSERGGERRRENERQRNSHGCRSNSTSPLLRTSHRATPSACDAARMDGV